MKREEVVLTPAQAECVISAVLVAASGRMQNSIAVGSIREWSKASIAFLLGHTHVWEDALAHELVTRMMAAEEQAF